MKKDLIIIFIVIIIILGYCYIATSTNNLNKDNIYKVMSKVEDNRTVERQKEKFYIGYIVLPKAESYFKDELSKLMVEIAKSENIGQAFFFSTENAADMLTGELTMIRNIYENQYIAKIDMSNKFLKWRKKVTTDDIVYNNIFFEK